MNYLLLLALLLRPALADEPTDLRKALSTAWETARTDTQWRSPYAAERSALRQAMVHLADNAETCPDWAIAQASELLAPADLSLDRIDIGDTHLLLIREDRERRGVGLVAIRCGPASDRVLQAPHSFFDVHTGDIVRKLFVETDARAAMWNTVHRYKALPDEHKSDEVHPADVTREAGSLFQAATVGLAVGDSTLKFVQVHGFYRSASKWEAIVSTGDPDKAPLITARKLAPALGDVAAYGQDVRELGGTINVQGKMLRTFDTPRFLHLELSAETRALIAKDAALRARFQAALAEGGW